MHPNGPQAHIGTTARHGDRMSSGLLDEACVGINLDEEVTDRRFDLLLSHDAAVGPCRAEAIVLVWSGQPSEGL
jgi:hypothetical protein